jgi:hypothetical protein
MVSAWANPVITGIRCARPKGLFTDFLVDYNKNVLSEDDTIRYNHAKSVLKYPIGDEIKLNEAGFISISGLFL